MNGPSPALVTARAARPLPRLPLWLLCAAYVVPGLVGRDPWRGADLAAFGQMVAIAEERTGWWRPMLGGLPTDAPVLPHWLGALSIAATSPWLDAAVAARLPFALLLALTLALVWYSTFHLARSEAAQPVAFAFGGEADPVSYARAMADGALLALIATLGLLRLGHETTPELLQLAAAALALYGLAAAPHRPAKARAAVLLGWPLLAAAGAPTMALALGVLAFAACLGSADASQRRLAAWVAAAAAAGAAVAVLTGTWRWRVDLPAPADWPSLARQWLWFLWPGWLLAVWTLWRWRRQLLRRHVALPLGLTVVALAANVVTGGADRALLLGLPGLAVLAAFALPTLRRSASAAIDWFSMIFFTLSALTIWVIYVAMHTGVPAKPAANVAKLAPGFAAEFSAAALALALAGTVAWVALVRWRTGRQREALWKSLVLPASGVALSWLLLMTLWLPLLDYARSPRVWVQRVAEHVGADACIATPGLAPAGVAALEHLGRWRVDARTDAASATGCERLLLVFRQGRHQALPPAPPGWSPLAEVMRPTDRDEITAIYRRLP